MGVLLPSLQSGLLNQSSAQVIDGSLKFNKEKSQVLTRTPGSASNRRTWTFSFWIKLFQNSQNILATFGLSGGGGSQTGLDIRFTSDFKLQVANQVNNSNAWALASTAVHRDTGWYHVVIAHDTTKSVESDRVKMYVNGKQITSFSTSSYPSLNYESSMNKALPHRIGSWDDSGSIYAPMEGMLSNVYMIDGQALGSGYFGFTDPLTGTWRPKKFKAEGTTVNDGTVWSSKVTGANNPANAFDGSVSSNMDNNGSAGTPIVLTATLKNVTSFRYYTSNSSAHDVTFNGATTIRDAAASGWRTIDNPPSTITSISWIHSSQPGSYVIIEAIEIDGVIMTDSTTTNLSFGTNGFYLPMDGNSLIGQDKSGKGNNWTPVNFGGFTTLDKATGALPILNTVSGGNYASAGVRTDTYANNLVLALPLVGSANDVSSYFKNRVVGTLTRLRFKTDWNWMYVSAIEINGTILTTGTLDNSGSVWTDPDKWKNGSVGSGQETYSQSARGDWFDVTLASSIQLETLRIYVYLDSSSGSTTNIFELELFFNDISNLTKVISTNNGAPNGNFNQRSWQDFKDVRTKILASNGNVTASSDQSNFYGGSYYFDGNGDYLTTDLSSVSLSSAYTVEFWWNKAGTQGGNHGHFCLNGTQGTHTITYREAAATGTSSNDFYVDLGGSFVPGLITQTINTGQWNHFAFVHEGSGVFKSYLNGVLQTTKTVGTTGTMGDTTSIGGGIGSYTTQFVNGYISDYRIYQAAKYTSNFIPASTDPNIFPDTPSGVSGGSKLAKITDGAVNFQADLDYLNVGDSSDYAFGTGDFTIEAFYFSRGSTDQQTIFGDVFGNSSGIYFRKREPSNGSVLGVYTNTDIVLGATAVSDNIWHHVALTREGSTIRLFLDGKLDGSATDSTNLTSTEYFIGDTAGTSSGEMNGFISNLRVIKGTALYTSNFTPPTEPLTNVTNTKLLCCQSNTSADAATILPDSLFNASLSATAFTDGSPTGATITNTGSIVTASAGTNSFSISNAASLDGSSQRLTTNNTNISFINSWTVDVYFKLDSSASGFNALINSGYGAQTSNYMYIGIDDDEKPYIETSAAGSRSTASSAISKDVWYHGRIIQNLSNIRFFVNGTSVVTHARNTVDLKTAGTFTIGSLLDNGNNANNFHGLIGPVRVFDLDIGDPASGGNTTTGGTLSNVSGTPGSITANGNAAATNFNPFNFDINTVHGNPSNYCTWNPIFIDAGGTNNRPCNLSNGNLIAESPNSGDWNIALGTVQVSRGKYYWELIHLQGNVSCMMGVIANTNGGMFNSNSGFYYNPLTWTYYLSTGNKRNGSASGSSYGVAGANGDVIGVAMDLDRGTISISKNGVSMGVMYDNLPAGEEFTAIWGATAVATTNKVSANFGQKPFKYTPPEGHGTLSGAGARKSTVIPRPDQYFGVTTYTGTGATRSLTTGFKPDFLWIKERGASGGPVIVDSVRGASATLQTHAPTQEQADSNAVTGFNPYGFSLGSGYTVVSVNGSTRTYVGWAWKAGGNSNTFNIDDVGYASAAAAGLTAGTITPTGASVGTRQGFSIVTFTASGSAGSDSCAHGLNNVPGMVIIKRRDASDNWYTWHSSFSNPQRNYILLDSTDDVTLSTNDSWGAGMTSSVIGFRSQGTAVGNMLAYIWHDVPGLQKFGSYSSNNSTDGPFIELGFRPALVMVKESGADGQSWNVFDNQRDPFNPTSKYLAWNSSSQEGTLSTMDFLSNGFKIRNNDNGWNGASSTFIYAAWAESPTFNLFGGQSNAR